MMTKTTTKNNVIFAENPADASIHLGLSSAILVGGLERKNMKIRTDFVTNSSSYSSAEIVIDNPVLLEILQKYKDMGTFDPIYSDFNIGNYEDYRACPLPAYEEISKTPALHVGLPDAWGNTWGNVPASLKEVVECVLACIKDGEMIEDQSLFTQLQTELGNRQNEILASYKHVDWKWGELIGEGLDEDYDLEISFVFDPINGEKYDFKHSKESPSGEEDDDETIETE